MQKIERPKVTDKARKIIDLIGVQMSIYDFQDATVGRGMHESRYAFVVTQLGLYGFNQKQVDSGEVPGMFLMNLISEWGPRTTLPYKK
ncbi:MAG: hypothetical protein V1900_01775 [Candidatus Aenigmatarchaeota archaeon]